MSKPNSLVVDDVRYVREDSLKSTEGDIKIAVLDRGFVYVGYVKKEDDFYVIRKASNIRQWGTTKGLGELVSGPTKTTKLDPAGTVRVPARALISLLDVEQSAWKLL